jgi:hypothetical protein
MRRLGFILIGGWKSLLATRFPHLNWANIETFMHDGIVERSEHSYARGVLFSAQPA